MAWSYERLWILLIQRKLKRTDLLKSAGISTSALSKMGKDLPVGMDVLDKVCNFLGCKIEDIVEHIPDTIAPIYEQQ